MKANKCARSRFPNHRREHTTSQLEAVGIVVRDGCSNAPTVLQKQNPEVPLWTRSPRKWCSSCVATALPLGRLQRPLWWPPRTLSKQESSRLHVSSGRYPNNGVPDCSALQGESSRDDDSNWPTRAYQAICVRAPKLPSTSIQRLKKNWVGRAGQQKLNTDFTSASRSIPTSLVKRFVSGTSFATTSQPRQTGHSLQSVRSTLVEQMLLRWLLLMIAISVITMLTASGTNGRKHRKTCEKMFDLRVRDHSFDSGRSTLSQFACGKALRLVAASIAHEIAKGTLDTLRDNNCQRKLHVAVLPHVLGSCNRQRANCHFYKNG